MGGNYSLFDGVMDLVVVLDAEHRVVYRNPTAARVIGDRWEASRDAAFAKTLRTGEPTQLEWATTVNGVRTQYEAQLSRVDDGVLCISRDITKLKRTEERLRSAEKLMVDTQGVAHLGTWEWDVSQPNATWSAELYRIYGLTPETYAPSYDAYLTMVHEDDRARVIEATNRVFHEHVPYSHDERIFRPDGTMRYLHTWAHPVLDENGKLTHLIGVCQDITDRALAEEALQRANTELEQRVSERTAQLESALRDLEAFTAMASHDLRAPLTVMQLVVDVWAKDPDRSKERAATYLVRMQRAVRTMADLLDGLLGFARIGEAAIRPAEIDVSALAAEIAGELRATAPDREATFEIDPDLRVHADPALFRVVLSNLLGNAWKYSQRKPSTKIEVGRTGKQLVIRDNGIGFDMREYPDLFAPFKRLTSARDFNGSGIGLATVQRIVERHGGAISAEGRPNEGSTFFIELPVLR